MQKWITKEGKEIKKREYKRLQKRVARLEAFLKDNGAYDESLTS